MAKAKGVGRPPGAANKANNNPRNESCNIRCSEGFNRVLAILMEKADYKSKADVLHDALDLLARKKTADKATNYWITKI